MDATVIFCMYKKRCLCKKRRAINIYIHMYSYLHKDIQKLTSLQEREKTEQMGNSSLYILYF